MVSVGEVEPAAVVATLRQALDAIGRLSAERAGVEEALKVEKNNDNILPRIMAAGGQHDKLFAEELKKYEPLKVRAPASLLVTHGRSQLPQVSMMAWRIAARLGSERVWLP